MKREELEKLQKEYNSIIDENDGRKKKIKKKIRDQWLILLEKLRDSIDKEKIYFDKKYKIYGYTFDGKNLTLFSDNMITKDKEIESIFNIYKENLYEFSNKFEYINTDSYQEDIKNNIYEVYSEVSNIEFKKEKNIYNWLDI